MPNPTRWGIISCGKISGDFAASLLSAPSEHVVIAAAARNPSSANEFAKQYGVNHVSNSYEDLTTDPSVDVVYIGAINPEHFRLVKMAITNGKSVLCEKPMGMNSREIKELVKLAKEKGVFLMEGIWSRCFPIYRRIREELQKGSIGEVMQVIVPFCVAIAHKERISLKQLGGGTTLDIGVYCVQFASFVFDGAKPTKIIAGGHLNSDGIDESTSATLLYPGGKTATLITMGTAKYEGDAVIIGTTGVIRVPFRFWCPTELITPGGKESIELPSTKATFNYGNSVGLLYEADEVRRCLQQGLKESPLLTLDETILISEIMESIRKQAGVVYPQDSIDNISS